MSYRAKPDRALLTQERGEILAKMHRTLDKCEHEGRNLSTAESVAYDEMQSRVTHIDARLAASAPAHRDLSGLATTEGRNAVSGQGETAVRIGAILGEEMRALGGASGSGSFVVPDLYSTHFVDALVAKSVVLQSGVLQLPMISDTLHVPVESSDMTSAWVAEAATISPSDPTFVEKVLLAQKLAALTVVSNEVLSDSNPSIQDLVVNQLTRSLALGLDLALLEGAGHGSNTPPGLEGTAGIGSVSMGTNGAAFTNLDPIVNAISTVVTANGNPDSIVLHPSRWQEILLLKEVAGSNKPLIQGAGAVAGNAGVTAGNAAGASAAAGTGRSIFGIPVYLSAQISTTRTQGTASGICSNAYVYDSSQVVVGRRNDVEIFVDPYSLANTDQVRIRATSRWDSAVLHAPAVCKIIGIL